MRKIFPAFILFLTLIFPNLTYAQNAPSATIINPIRGPQLGLKNANLPESLKGQWQATRGVRATWLWQYSALENQEMINFAKQNMKDQEHGLFLEIDRNTAEKSGVDYKGRREWYHSDGLLLVSYDDFERHKIIDHIFSKFKQTFGYYPKSVGAWWVGAEPIQYMYQKYGVYAILHCADQYATDAYAIWGTPWSIPYLPRKNNSAIPAIEINDALPVVVMQWAPRDPLRGYGPSVQNSTFSIQDYEVKSYNIGYFEYLNQIFAQKNGDQLVFGLEGGFPPEVYNNQYTKQIMTAQNLQKKQKMKIQTMDQFARDFLKLNQSLAPTRVILSKDYTSNNQSFIFNSSSYRLILNNYEKELSIVDIRDYKNTFSEDFYTVPNTQPMLRINTSSIIDTVKFPDSKINLGKIESALVLRQQANKYMLMTGDRKVGEFTDYQIKIWDQNKKLISYDFTPRWYDQILNLFKTTQDSTTNRVTITPFEDQAVEFLKQQKKEVVFLLPELEPIYRATRPKLLADYKYGPRITGRKWEYLAPSTQVDNKLQDKLIVVPSYLGSGLYSLGNAASKHKKIFDNFQIQIYEP